MLNDEIADEPQSNRIPPRHPWLNGKRRAMEKARQTYVEQPTLERTPVPAAEPRLIVKRKRRLVID
ncbi:hypothetical protein DPV79_38820 [Burkholderia reimsis]|uniref:Uncharacterized protein n=1 Tax=Burkholderia reimsis TaxID=2234132 RepID=A0A365QJ55_9BURK|nr:hypothetical protein DPV79_38820 [Burkholderia reimsis]